MIVRWEDLSIDQYMMHIGYNSAGVDVASVTYFSDNKNPWSWMVYVEEFGNNTIGEERTLEQAKSRCELYFK